jgi:integrase
MRQGELLGLRWEDVSLERSSLVVRSSLSRLPAKPGRRGTRYVITAPKTERSRRTVALRPEVVAVLRELRKEYLRHPPALDQGLVFATPSGSPLDGTAASRRFSDALVRAGLPRVRFHDLRHGAASMLIERGVDLATVSAILGHSNIGTTVDLYGHLTETHKRDAMLRLMEA